MPHSVRRRICQQAKACCGEFHIGETDDAPGAVLIGFFVMIAIIFAFGYWKGEKPKWSWGR